MLANLMDVFCCIFWQICAYFLLHILAYICIFVLHIFIAYFDIFIELHIYAYRHIFCTFQIFSIFSIWTFLGPIQYSSFVQTNFVKAFSANYGQRFWEVSPLSSAFSRHTAAASDFLQE